ncbi:TPA: putative zinc ribbon protein [Serratia fonticola]
MHYLKLQRAIDPEGQTVLANDAVNQNEDTYFCPSCGCAVILHPSSPQRAWFEHDKREVTGTTRHCIYLAFVGNHHPTPLS